MLKVFLAAIMVLGSVSTFAATLKDLYHVSTKLKMNGEYVFKGGIIVGLGDSGHISTETYGEGTSLQVYTKKVTCPGENRNQECVKIHYSISDIHSGVYELLSNPTVILALNKDAAVKVKNINGDELELLTKVENTGRVPASTAKEEPIGTQISRDIQDKEP